MTDDNFEKMGDLYAGRRDENGQRIPKTGWIDCDKCGLCESRSKVVFGEGNPNAHLMIIGEAPGEKEDLSGNPFQGNAGRIVDDFLSHLNSTREEVFLTNVLACRPPGNRNPSKDEIKACLPRLYQTIRLVDPYVILLLGSVALKALTEEKRSISKVASDDDLPGLKVNVPGVQVPVSWPAFATYHPAYLARNYSKEEGGEVHRAYLCWEKAFHVADGYAEHYRGIIPPLRKKHDSR